jgi:hypothetical protein
MGPEPEATVRALRARQPRLQIVECDDDRPRLRVHPIGGGSFMLEPVTAGTLREALAAAVGTDAPSADERAANGNGRSADVR